MQRSMMLKTIQTRILKPSSTNLVKPSLNPNPNPNPSCDVFINHRGIDTKKTVAGLLFLHLSTLGFNPFLDSHTMRPGDNLFDKINSGIVNCDVGVAVFSRRYCESYFCLHELALMMECKKMVLPVFCDIKPSELRISINNGSCSIKELERFERALEKAKNTVGLTFNTSEGDWSEFLRNATIAITQSMLQVKEDQVYKYRPY